VKALFPISLSNQRFATAKVEPALRVLAHRHHEIVFLVADQLQLYNKALRVGSGLSYSEALAAFRANGQYFEERERWIRRLRLRLEKESLAQNWRVVGIADFADGDCFRVFRNVIVAYDSVDAFRVAIEATARQHALERPPEYGTDRAQRLSRSYVLEEIALSVRIRVWEAIHDEFYFGRHADVVIRLYAGAYGFSVFDLAEKPESTERFRFWEYDAGAEGWHERLSGDAGGPVVRSAANVSDASSGTAS
jgi:hypothetical protein